MTTDVINGVPRSLLEQAAIELEHDNGRYMLGRELRKLLATAQPAAEVIETDCRSEEGVTVGLIDALIAICRPLATRDLATPATCAALEDLRSDSDALAIFLGLPPEAEGFEVRELFASPPAQASAWVPERYTCIGKGGEYQLLGLAQGAGTLKGFNHMVYRNRDGVMFVREPEDFLSRMEKIAPTPGASDGRE